MRRSHVFQDYSPCKLKELLRRFDTMELFRYDVVEWVAYRVHDVSVPNNVNKLG